MFFLFRGSLFQGSLTLHETKLLLMVQKSGDHHTCYVWNPMKHGIWSIWCRISSIIVAPEKLGIRRMIFLLGPGLFSMGRTCWLQGVCNRRIARQSSKDRVVLPSLHGHWWLTIGGAKDLVVSPSLHGHEKNGGDPITTETSGMIRSSKKVVVSTQLKNMLKSNWIPFPQIFGAENRLIYLFETTT